MFGFFGAQAKRKRLLKSATNDLLRDFFSDNIAEKNISVDSVPLLAVDFETTGLDAAKDEILSIGFVQINNLQIDLSTATHLLIKTNNPLSADTVVIHKITDDQINKGMSLEDAIEHLLSTLKGKILVAHHAQIESNFLNQACKKAYGSEIIIPVIDTLAIEARKLPQHQHANNNLNLTMCSQRYNLPRYKLHDALSDALSCAELLLAQLAYSDIEASSKLKDLINYKP